MPGAIAISACSVSRVLLRACIHLAVVACTIPSLASCHKNFVVDMRHITSFGPDILGLQRTLHGPEDPSTAQRENGVQRVTKAAIRSKMCVGEPGQNQEYSRPLRIKPWFWRPCLCDQFPSNHVQHPLLAHPRTYILYHFFVYSILLLLLI